MAPSIRDRLLYENPTPPPNTTMFDLKTFRGELGRAMAFNIDNVADYFYGPHGKETWLKTDFPNVAPPFETFWMEYRRPWHVASLADVDAWNRKMGYTDLPPEERPIFGETALPERVGIAVQAERHSEGSAFGAGIVGRAGHVSSEALLLDADRGTFTPFTKPAGSVDPDGWSAVVGIFADWHGTKEIHGPFLFQMEIGANGEFLDYSALVDTMPGQPRDLDLIAAIWVAASDLVLPALLAISFLHCKNVTVEREEAKPPRLVAAFKKRHGVLPYRFNVLHIEPMRKVLAEAGAEGETGLKRALHIARGHFKDYREGRGLFGRLHGMYFWDQQMRGSVEAGYREKTYTVEAPGKERT